MLNDLKLGAKEIFQYKEMLKDVVFASMNTPGEYMDKIFPIYEEIVDLLESFAPFNIEEFNEFISQELITYNEQPFFPVLAGLYVNALVNKLLESHPYIELNLMQLCAEIIDDATKHATSHDEAKNENEISFSLDFMGYLLHPEKKLTIIGPVGDYCGALMGKNSTLVLHGMHGKHLGYEKAESAEIFVED